MRHSARGGFGMKRTVVALATAALSLGLVVTNAAGSSASASSFSAAVAQVASGRLGYHVSNPAAFVRAKALAAARAGQHLGGAQGNGPKGTIDTQWDGVFDNSLTPPDPTGAIGPNSYLELINQKYGIYMRNGTLINSGTLAQLSNDNVGFVGDPQILWDTND